MASEAASAPASVDDAVAGLLGIACPSVETNTSQNAGTEAEATLTGEKRRKRPTRNHSSTVRVTSVSSAPAGAVEADRRTPGHRHTRRQRRSQPTPLPVVAAAVAAKAAAPGPKRGKRAAAGAAGKRSVGAQNVSKPAVSSPAADTTTIIERSRTHWLSNDDIYELLCNFADHGLSVRDTPIQNPPSGTLYVYNRLVTKHYRDDNIPLRKRPDRSNSAKECHMKLKLRDQYVMNAVYASCLPDEDGTCFSRRVYSRLDDPTWPYVLVHYLQAGNTRVYAWNSKRRAGRRTSRPRVTANTRATKRARRGPTQEAKAAPTKAAASTSPAASCGEVRRPLSKPPTGTFISAAPSPAPPLLGANDAPRATHGALPVAASSSTAPPAVSPARVGSALAALSGAAATAAAAAATPAATADAFAPGVSRALGQAAMYQHLQEALARQLMQQQAQQAQSTKLHSSLLAHAMHGQQAGLLQHVDLAPRMLSSRGGNLVVTRVMGNQMLLNLLAMPGAQLECQFGHTAVPALCVEPGIVRCTAPPHAAGMVPFAVRLNGATVSLPIAFTYVPSCGLQMLPGLFSPVPGMQQQQQQQQQQQAVAARMAVMQ